MGKPGKNPVVDRAERQALLDDIQRRFGVELLWHEKLVFPGYRPDATTHTFFDPEGIMTEGLRREIRTWVEGRGWHFSRQMVPVSGKGGERVEYVYLVPITPVALAVGYHATRRASLASIMEKGLLPGAPDRQTTAGRWDCEGNIYLCEQLGTPADAGVRGSGSAHWWRAHLAEANRFNDPDWVILGVEVGRAEGCRTYRDIWSSSGIIVDGVPRVPPDLLRLEYPRDPEAHGPVAQ
jgi:hypothetical protein